MRTLVRAAGQQELKDVGATKKAEYYFSLYKSPCDCKSVLFLFQCCRPFLIMLMLLQIVVVDYFVVVAVVVIYFVVVAVVV
jgi:hypothetical protein